jgi:hypothetical protein
VLPVKETIMMIITVIIIIIIQFFFISVLAQEVANNKVSTIRSQIATHHNSGNKEVFSFGAKVTCLPADWSEGIFSLLSKLALL